MLENSCKTLITPLCPLITLQVAGSSHISASLRSGLGQHLCACHQAV